MTGQVTKVKDRIIIQNMNKIVSDTTTAEFVTNQNPD